MRCQRVAKPRASCFHTATIPLCLCPTTSPALAQVPCDRKLHWHHSWDGGVEKGEMQWQYRSNSSLHGFARGTENPSPPLMWCKATWPASDHSQVVSAHGLKMVAGTCSMLPTLAILCHLVEAEVTSTMMARTCLKASIINACFQLSLM